MSLELATENQTPMKAKKQASTGTPNEQIMDYDLRICTLNIRTLNREGASAQLAEALIECRADITVIQQMRWIGHGYESQAHCNIYYMARIRLRVRGWPETSTPCLRFHLGE